MYEFADMLKKDVVIYRYQTEKSVPFDQTHTHTRTHTHTERDVAIYQYQTESQCLSIRHSHTQTHTDLVIHNSTRYALQSIKHTHRNPQKSV